MNECLTTWFLGLPGWARTIICIATATALATWIIVITLPNPLTREMSEIKQQLRMHVTVDAQNRELLRLMCHGITKMANDNMDKCDLALSLPAVRDVIP